MTIGSSGTLSNSQCTVNASGNSAEGNGNTLTLTVTASPTFTGPENIYLLAIDSENVNSGWQNERAWTPASDAAPTVGTFSASPNPANQGTEVFTATFLNQNTAKTYTDLTWSYVLITNAARSGANACYVRYYQPTRSLYLVNDNGTGVMGPLTIGSSGMLSNSQCTVNAIGSSAQGLGSTLTLTLSLTASPTFTGTKDIYALAIDGANSNSGWQNEGTWTP